MVAYALSKKFEDSTTQIATLSLPFAGKLKLLSDYASKVLDETKYHVKDGLLFYKG